MVEGWTVVALRSQVASRANAKKLGYRIGSISRRSFISELVGSSSKITRITGAGFSTFAAFCLGVVPALPKTILDTGE